MDLVGSGKYPRAVSLDSNKLNTCSISSNFLPVAALLAYQGCRHVGTATFSCSVEVVGNCRKMSKIAVEIKSDIGKEKLMYTEILKRGKVKEIKECRQKCRQVDKKCKQK